MKLRGSRKYQTFIAVIYLTAKEMHFNVKIDYKISI